MGNIIKSERQAKVKPEQTLATVRAAGAFKARLNQSNRKSTAEQIEKTCQQNYGRKKSDARRLDSISELHEQTPDDVDHASKEILKLTFKQR